MNASKLTVLLYILSILAISSACRNETEVIIPVHRATHQFFKDFKDFKKCISESGDTFVAKHLADTFYLQGEAVSNQVPVYQVVNHQLTLSDIQVTIEFEACAKYDSSNLIRTYDEFVMRIMHRGISNELVLKELPREIVCKRNCQYKDTITLLGETHSAVLTMRSPQIPATYYLLENEGKFIGFKCSDGRQYKWID
ncbi:MAG: hypothetical protein ACK4KT_06805 [Thermaurantimonas sp.]